MVVLNEVSQWGGEASLLLDGGDGLWLPPQCSGCLVTAGQP